MPARKLIGVCPPQARAERARLFKALEHAFAVRFEARHQSEWRGLDALILVNEQLDVSGVPCPCLVILPSTCETRTPSLISFADDAALDARLRGQTLLETRVPQSTAHLRPLPGDRVLGACAAADRPVWVLRESGGIGHHVVATMPDDLRETETLRDRLRAGAFVGVLPLVHFLRFVESNLGWTEPSLRAAFIFDDPNVRAKSYGFLSFPRLADHAQHHGYHVVVASIPLDYRSFDPYTVAMFRDRTQELSLAVHGNDHDRLELLRARTRPRALAVAAQALRRTADFERRSSLSVARVMCPPHEVCGEAMYEALFRLGFEGISMARVLRSGTDCSATSLLGEWAPAQLVAGGLPILPRHSFARPLDDIVLRAFLNHPLLLFGHHQDVAGGLDGLARAAARINALGHVEWISLTEICRSNFAVRQSGSSFHVRVYARRVSVKIPHGIHELTIEVPPVASTYAPVLAMYHGASDTLDPSVSKATSVSFEGPFPERVDFELVPTSALAPEQVPPPPWRLWPIVRRGLTEGRDRTAPLRERLTASAGRILTWP